MTMMGMAKENIATSFQAVLERDVKRVESAEATEEYIDYLNKEISQYISNIIVHETNEKDFTAISAYFKITGNIERIGDYGKKLLEYYAYRQNRPKDFSQQAMTELSGMYAEAHHAIVTALDGFINDDPDKAREVAPIAGKLRGLEVELRNRHIQRLDKQECDSETGLVYVDILGIIEHIGYHSNNVAKATISSCTAEHKAKA